MSFQLMSATSDLSLSETVGHLQARQLNEKSKKLEETDLSLQSNLQALASERAQLTQAQAVLESESAANRQLSAELAGESESLGKQRRGLDVREAAMQDKTEACERAAKVHLPSMYCTWCTTFHQNDACFLCSSPTVCTSPVWC